jgi:hypothetical protein
MPKKMTYFLEYSEGQAISVTAWTDLEISRRMRLPDFKTIGTWRW